MIFVSEGLSRLYCDLFCHEAISQALIMHIQVWIFIIQGI